MKLRQGFAGLFVVTVVLSGCTVTTTPYGVAVGPAPVVVAPAPPPPGAPPPVAPAPGVVVEPEYYIWDGYEYVGWYNGAWLSWNGGVWLGSRPSSWAGFTVGSAGTPAGSMGPSATNTASRRTAAKAPPKPTNE